MVRPVIVHGVAHSGTTILYRMLAQHPHANWLSQYSLRDGTVPERRRVPFAPVADRWLRKVAPPSWRKERRGIIGALRPFPSEAARTWAWAVPESIDAPELATPRITAALTRQAAVTGQPTIIIKMPRLYRHTALFRRAFTDTVAVQIIRDPVAVSISISDKFQDRPDPEHAAVVHWREVVTTLSSDPGIHTITYEELCGDVHGTIRTVLRWAGLPARHMPWARIPERLHSTNTARRGTVSATRAQELLAAAGDAAERYR